MNKKQLSERDICTKYITPALEKAGWDVTTQVREEFPLTKGSISWAKNPEGMTGEELIDFVNNDLFPALKKLATAAGVSPHGKVVGSVFEDAYNYMKSGNHRDPEELMVEYQQIVHQLEAAQVAFKAELMACPGGKA